MKQVIRGVAARAGVVSIHTRHYWRVKHSIERQCEIHEIVSIHTRHYWRVKRYVAARQEIASLFQSTPAITGG